MTVLLTTLLQAQAQGAMSPAIQQFIMIGLIVVVFYFFMIRPQVRKTKLEKEFKESLKKGDKIVTIGGVHGKILEINDTTFIIEIDQNVKVKLEKSAISAEATKQYQTPEAKK
jgi:preprotein translocase subunit YajC